MSSNQNSNDIFFQNYGNILPYQSINRKENFENEASFNYNYNFNKNYEPKDHILNYKSTYYKKEPLDSLNPIEIQIILQSKKIIFLYIKIK